MTLFVDSGMSAGQRSITKFFRPIATGSTPLKKNEGKPLPDPSGENCSPNKMTDLMTPEKNTEAKKRKLEDGTEVEESPNKNTLTPGNLIIYLYLVLHLNCSCGNGKG